MSKIEWTDKTWNPISGCSKISTGCDNCYAERMAKRLKGRFGYSDIVDPFSVTFHQDKLAKPVGWKKPQRVFVCSMGDLFHEDVQFSWARAVFRIMLQANHHTYMILTKRPDKMRRFYEDLKYHDDFGSMDNLDHVWLGVSVEDQEQADKRIRSLLKTPAAVKFVSVEPMLKPIDLTRSAGMCACGNMSSGCPACHPRGYLLGIDWIIIGAESGPGARKIDNAHILNLAVQCEGAKVPVFLKQAWINDKLVKMPKMGSQVWDQFPRT